ncbi:hypothetical protein ACEUA8_01440 [Aeromonas veronii]
MIEWHLRDKVQTWLGLTVVAPSIAPKDIKKPCVIYSVRSLTTDKRADGGIQRLYSLDYTIFCDSYGQAKQYQELLLGKITYYDEYIETDNHLLHIVCDDTQVIDLYNMQVPQITINCDFTVTEF